MICSALLFFSYILHSWIKAFLNIVLFVNCMEKAGSDRLLKGVLVVFLALFLILYGFWFSVFHGEVFEKEFGEGLVDGKAKLELHSGILDFLKGNGEISEVFDGREVAHMQDVQQVFSLLKSVILFSVLVVVVVGGYLYHARKYNYKSFLRLLIYSGLIVDVMLLVFVAAIFLDFNGFFVWMHGLFFDPGTWIFPAESGLIQLYPLDFFMEMGTLVGRNLFLIANLFIGAGLLIPSLKRRKWIFH